MRRSGLVMLVLGGLIMFTALWILVTGLLARSQLADVRAELAQMRSQIRAGDLAAARATAADVATRAHRAHLLTTGPFWSVVAAIPHGGEPLDAVRGVTASLDVLGKHALPPLVAASQQLDPAKLRPSGATIDVSRFAAAAPLLDRASAQMDSAIRAVHALPGKTWLSFVDSARSDVLTNLDDLRRTVHSAQLASRIAPRMLGADGLQRYFIAFQNDAEARGTGGLPGAFAIVEADHGKLRFAKFESDTKLLGVRTGLRFGAAYEQLYGADTATSAYVDSNLSPHFPYAAQIWAALWTKVSGQHIDGAFAVDPTAVSLLLSATGPVTIPGGAQLNADNVVPVTQNLLYQRYPTLDKTDTAARKKVLLQVASAVSRRLLRGGGSSLKLLQAAGAAAGQRRLLAWSADPAIERELQQTALSGAIPVTRAPYVGLSVVNDGGNKLDYYLGRALTWQRSGCGARRDVTVTIKLHNGAPAGLPPSIAARSDTRSKQAKPGDNRYLVGYFATSGAQLSSVTVNGRPGAAAIGRQLGHPVYTVDFELPRATTGTIVLHLLEPAGTGKPIVLRQPGVQPLSVQLDDARCN